MSRHVVIMPRDWYVEFFALVARELRALGYRVSAITIGHRGTRDSIASGAYDRVVDLVARARARKGDPFARLQELEALYGEPGLGKAWYQDRWLSSRPHDKIAHWMAACGDVIEEVVSDLQPVAFMGEINNASEFLAYRVGRVARIPFMFPFSARLSPRLLFSYDPECNAWRTLERYLELQKGGSVDDAVGYIDMFRSTRVVQPFMTPETRRTLYPRQPFFESYVRHNVDQLIMDGGQNHTTEVQVPGRFRFRAWQRRRRIQAVEPLFKKSKWRVPHVSYFLHFQPEATINLHGTHCLDQAAVIKMLSYAIPAAHTLIIKEAPFTIGERPAGYFEEIAAIPNVQLIHPNVDSHAVLRETDLAVTVTGTVAFEQALFERPVLTLGNSFLNYYPGIRRAANLEHLDQDVTRALTDKVDSTTLHAFVQAIFDTAYPIEWQPGQESQKSPANAREFARAIHSELEFDPLRYMPADPRSRSIPRPAIA